MMGLLRQVVHGAENEAGAAAFHACQNAHINAHTRITALWVGNSNNATHHNIFADFMDAINWSSKRWEAAFWHADAVTCITLTVWHYVLVLVVGVDVLLLLPMMMLAGCLVNNSHAWSRQAMAAATASAWQRHKHSVHSRIFSAYKECIYDGMGVRSERATATETGNAQIAKHWRFWRSARHGTTWTGAHKLDCLQWRPHAVRQLQLQPDAPWVAAYPCR